MQGIIAIWSGAIVDIPFGWKLCDGNNGTPDLRDSFIRGAGGAIAPGVTGGESSHHHTNSHGSHNHDLPAGSSIAAGSDFNYVSTTSLISDDTGETNHIPPYYALAYIMHI